MNESNCVVCEYIWIGGNNEIRSKTRVFPLKTVSLINIPEWNYDGSSTDQADSDGNTEVLLKPCAIYKDTIRCFSNCECLLVLCDTYNSDDIALSSNHRNNANVIFSEIDKEECWFGLEQEYFIRFNNQTFEPINNVGACVQTRVFAVKMPWASHLNFHHHCLNSNCCSLSIFRICSCKARRVRHGRVGRWTKSLNIIEKDFL